MNTKTITTFAAASLLLLHTLNSAAQSSATGIILGHEYVDLGLSVMWATCNVGATQPGECGQYFAWGEGQPKDEYTDSNSATYEKTDITFVDAATAQWFSAWRMPTAEECQELITQCTWKWTTLKGQSGYMVKSKVNGKTIFLPSAGYRDGIEVYELSDMGFYWSSTTFADDTEYARYLEFDTAKRRLRGDYRYIGRTVRAVTVKTDTTAANAK